MSSVFYPVHSICRECDRSFSCVFNMRMHQRSLRHGGLSPGQCPACVIDLEGGSEKWHNTLHHRVSCPVATCSKLVVFWGLQQHHGAKHTEPFRPYTAIVSERLHGATDLKTATNLKTFADQTLLPDQEFKESVGRAVDALYRRLTSQIFGATEAHTISEIIKGGSLAKGTALNKNSDIDLILFFNGYESYDDFKPAIRGILDKMEIFIQNNSNLATFHGRTKHSIEVKVSSGSFEIKVDLLPAIDVLNMLGSPQAVYEKMWTKSSKRRQFYAVALAPKQIEFVKDAVSLGQQPLQDLIRIVKHWRKDYFHDVTTHQGRLPTSFFFELVTIHCWQEADKPISFDLNVALRSVMEKLRNNNTLEIVWEQNYRKTDCGQLTKRAPYVMDPANPTNNVMHRYDAWKTVSEKAEQLIMAPVLWKVPYQQYCWKY